MQTLNWFFIKKSGIKFNRNVLKISKPIENEKDVTRTIGGNIMILNNNIDGLPNYPKCLVN